MATIAILVLVGYATLRPDRRAGERFADWEHRAHRTSGRSERLNLYRKVCLFFSVFPLIFDVKG